MLLVGRMREQVARVLTACARFFWGYSFSGWGQLTAEDDDESETCARERREFEKMLLLRKKWEARHDHEVQKVALMCTPVELEEKQKIKVDHSAELI